MIKTLHVPIYREYDRVVHTATIRSDWTESDHEALAEMFPDCYVLSQRRKRYHKGVKQPLSDLINLNFQQIRKFSTQNRIDSWYFRNGVWHQG